MSDSQDKAAPAVASSFLLGEVRSRRAIACGELGYQLDEELKSRGIEQPMNLGVFGEDWERVFGDKSGMLVEKALLIKLHKASSLPAD